MKTDILKKPKVLISFVGGFNWFVDYIIVPLSMVLSKIKKGFGTRVLSKLLLWACDTFSKPPFGVQF